MFAPYFGPPVELPLTPTLSTIAGCSWKRCRMAISRKANLVRSVTSFVGRLVIRPRNGNEFIPCCPIGFLSRSKSGKPDRTQVFAPCPLGRCCHCPACRARNASHAEWSYDASIFTVNYQTTTISYWAADLGFSNETSPLKI